MQTSKLHIRKAIPTQAETIRSLAATTFIATYGAYNTPDNMRDYVEKHFNRKTILSELSNPNIHYFLAETDDEIVGYTKLNQGAAQTESRFPDTLEIERIYVTRPHHGKGYGLALLNKAKEVAHEQSIRTIWLGVWDQNEKAIAFYEHNGFYKDGLHPFMLGEDPQRDYIMRFDF